MARSKHSKKQQTVSLNKTQVMDCLLHRPKAYHKHRKSNVWDFQYCPYCTILTLEEEELYVGFTSGWFLLRWDSKSMWDSVGTSQEFGCVTFHLVDKERDFVSAWILPSPQPSELRDRGVWSEEDSICGWQAGVGVDPSSVCLSSGRVKRDDRLWKRLN